MTEKAYCYKLNEICNDCKELRNNNSASTNTTDSTDSGQHLTVEIVEQCNDLLLNTYYQECSSYIEQYKLI